MRNRIFSTEKETEQKTLTLLKFMCLEKNEFVENYELSTFLQRLLLCKLDKLAYKLIKSSKDYYVKFVTKQPS